MSYNQMPKPNLANIRPLGTCQRCAFIYHLDELQWQYDYRGMQLQSLNILVCPTCLDAPQPQQKPIILPPDPVSVLNARPFDYVNANTNYLSTALGSHLVTASGTNLITEPNGDAMLDELYD